MPRSSSIVLHVYTNIIAPFMSSKNIEVFRDKKFVHISMHRIYNKYIK